MSTSQDHSVNILEDNATVCWGCGLEVLIPSSAPVFKCGWCGAITDRNACEHHRIEGYWWRRVRDWFFVCILMTFICFFIGGGVWAVYPTVFSVTSFFGIFHSFITMLLAVSTLFTFSLAAFRTAGPPPNIPWGSYSVVGKGGLENYTFCNICMKPKSPRTHHCRSCAMCVLDMDHHCPFIGNCVGAANHPAFIAFLISTILSTLYVTCMSAYVGMQIWPPMAFQSLGRLQGLGQSSFPFDTLKEVVIGVLGSIAQQSFRGFVLFYLLMASTSVEIALSVLLWQQLLYIYEGKTFLSHLKSEDNGVGQRDCKNLARFFGCSYPVTRLLPSFRSSKKIHNK